MIFLRSRPATVCAVPEPLVGDAIHTAVAAVHGIRYMLTWNVRHLANLNKREHLRAICLRSGVAPPEIVTPELLWEREE